MIRQSRPFAGLDLSQFWHLYTPPPPLKLYQTVPTPERERGGKRERERERQEYAYLSLSLSRALSLLLTLSPLPFSLADCTGGVHTMIPKLTKRENKSKPQRKEFFMNSLLVRIHLIIEIILVDWPCAMEV